MKFNIQAAGKTDVGLVRKNNEDNFGYDLREGVFVVCDGMGGQVAGELASKIAVETVLGYFRHEKHGSRVFGRGFDEVSDGANALANSIQLANRAIQDAALQSPDKTGMGSTIVALHVSDDLFSIGNVGDSRIYLVRDGTIQQITTDHSFVMEQVRRGLISVEEAEQSELQNVIVKALGTEESIEPDLADHQLEPGDTLLLCTDGLSRYVKDEVLLEILTAQGSLDEACSDLIEAAKASHSDDNITCLILRAAPQSWAGRVFDRFGAGKGSSIRQA